MSISDVLKRAILQLFDVSETDVKKINVNSK